MTATSDYMMSSINEQGINICGIAPKNLLTTLDGEPCFNCDQVAVVRRFSGSGWYEDDWLCSSCGEDVGSGYRPFRPRWRKENIEKAQEWLAVAIPREEFFKATGDLIEREMDWDD